MLPFAVMAKTVTSTARRRSRLSPSKKATLVYFTEQERQLVDQAARLERRSISSFIANIVIEAADDILTRRNQRNKQRDSAASRRSNLSR
ncbi:MAG: hypothetical protein DMG96_36645 [Acidobacteria bacterium]|nr:MAG: hypothetical protein DMG98_19465 [Acidobacteriota bacterium]PYV68354.1 MAG: hypothetical protein DMG96_36645 [Acidobacteriota bacterium]